MTLKETGTAQVICPVPYLVGTAWDMIRAYVQAVDSEVGGLGLVERRGNRLVVTEVFLLEQEVTRGTTELDAEAMAQLMVRLMKEGKEVKQLRFWWHSHHKMGVFWSGQDVATITGLARNGYFLALVTNRLEETRIRLSVGGEIPVSVDGLPLRVLRDVPMEVQARADAEVVTKVRRPNLLDRVVRHRAVPPCFAAEEFEIADLAETLGLGGPDV